MDVLLHYSFIKSVFLMVQHFMKYLIVTQLALNNGH